MKNIILATMVSFVLWLHAATPTITSVTAQQRYPWNGKVDISYKVTGDIAGYALTNGVITSLKVTATDKVANKTYTATTAALSGSTTLTAGNHAIVWDLEKQGVNLKSTNVVFNISCEATEALYCVIDLSAGANATSYPVTYLAAAPSGGFTNNTYRTTKLALRRCNAGSFQMQGSTTTTLTKPFYIGVFEVTQKQYSLVTGGNPSSSYYGNTIGDGFPVHSLTYSTIRGETSVANWPSSSAVGNSTFIGKIQERTKLNFDLPTEAQWEYACRAGSMTTYYWGGSMSGDYAWYTSNSGNTSHVVGTKKPNAWGLYDMSGNVWEYCVDWYGSSLQFGTDPKGPSSGQQRVLRGGSYYHIASYCTSSFRIYVNRSGATCDGFRLSRTLP